MKKIDIVGWYSKGNCGDEAFKYFHEEAFRGHQLNYVTPPNKCTTGDITILGGGAVVSPFYLNIIPNDKPKYAIGVDIAYESEIDILAKSNFKQVLVRSSSDLPALQAKLSCPVEAIPDLAFILEPELYPVHGEKKKIGVLVTDYVNPAIDRPIEKHATRAWSFIKQMAEKLDKLIELGFDIYLIPLSTGGYGNDLRINLDLMAFMKRQPINITEALTPPQAIGLLKEMDLNICMKFHAHIFSVIAETPFISIDFTRKVKMFMEENNLSNLRSAWFDSDRYCCDELIPNALKAIEDQSYSVRFKELSESNKAKLKDVIQRVRRDWLQ